MRLADFIEREQETILRNWEAFARRMIPAASDMTRLALRDHAQQILETIVIDLREDQTRLEQSEKSQGRAPVDATAPDTAAETHAVLRARSGFDIKQLIAEYRALRASVLQLWLDTTTKDASAFDDMRRFDEAIDQAVAESVNHFHVEVENTRNLLLAMLGHDMRGPLSTIVTTAATLAGLNAGDEVDIAANRLIRGSASLKSLLNDLVDFSRTRLGLGLHIERASVNLTAVIRDELEQVRGAYPGRPLELLVTEEVHGSWDGVRLQQLLRNLISNALQYGSQTAPIFVRVSGEPDAVTLVVSNRGMTIDPSQRNSIFDPLVRGSDEGEGLGLGLFIVRAIAEAHGGSVSCESDDHETAFTVVLPRVAEKVGA